MIVTTMICFPPAPRVRVRRRFVQAPRRETPLQPVRSSPTRASIDPSQDDSPTNIIYLSIYLSLSLYIYIYKYIYEYMYVHVYIYIYIYILVLWYDIYIYIYIYTCTYTHSYSYILGAGGLLRGP